MVLELYQSIFVQILTMVFQFFFEFRRHFLEKG